jgi:hypothetical protein
MGFRDNLFGRILCINMLKHIKVQPLDQTSDKIDRSSVVKAISDIFRILRKGGRVILTVPCTDGKVEDYTRTCKIYNPRTIFESVKCQWYVAKLQTYTPYETSQTS